MNPQQIWRAALGELQLQMTQGTFDTWLKPTSVLAYEDGTFIIGVRSGYIKEWLENRLLTLIKRTLVGLVGHQVEVRFVVWGGEKSQNPPPPLLEGISPAEEEDAVWPASSDTSALNSRYTFDTFVVGPSNRLAHAASIAVAEKPATAYNPLFIYGGVGLGKTHLLHAIGHACRRQGLTVLYVSSEQFTNDLIEAIRSHTTDDFRDKYRTMDVLLIDDIQFIAGKESTQEEFFHTFNTLHGSNKQIVISSDRPPKAMITLEERLRSRFEWGLIADIQPPDLETRIAILRFKAHQQPIPIPNEVLDYIARQIQSNIRELEGALNRVVAYARLMHQPLTPELVATALSDLLPDTPRLTTEEVINAVAAFYGLSPEALRGKSRRKEVALPRQIAMYLARQEAHASYPQIGAALGGRDHSTVHYAYEKIREKIEQDDRLRREILHIRERLYGNGVPR